MANSVLANLENRTTTEAATANTAENLRIGAILTGQYLYERLIGDNKEQVSMMDMIRGWSKNVDTATVKKALKDFVELAKEKGPAQLSTARSHQSNLRSIYGALRFAPDELTKEGYTEKTGYLVARAIARKALADKAIKWDGTKVKSPELKEQEQHSKESQAAMVAVMAENPQLMTENFSQWQERLRPLVEARIADMQQAKHDEAVKVLCDALFEKHPDLVRGIANELLTRLMAQDEVSGEDEEQE